MNHLLHTLRARLARLWSRAFAWRRPGAGSRQSQQAGTLFPDNATLDAILTDLRSDSPKPPAGSWQRALLHRLADRMEQHSHISDKNVSCDYSDEDQEAPIRRACCSFSYATTLIHWDKIDTLAPERLIAWLGHRAAIAAGTGDSPQGRSNFALLKGDIEHAVLVADYAWPQARVGALLAQLATASELTLDGSLILEDSDDLRRLPKRLTVAGDLVLRRCTQLTALPVELRVGGSIDLEGCSRLTQLPELTHVGGDLVLDECTQLKRLPERLTVAGSLRLSGNECLVHLPQSLTVGNHLDLSRCSSLRSLPDDLKVGGDIWMIKCRVLAHPVHRLQVGGEFT